MRRPAKANRSRTKDKAYMSVRAYDQSKEQSSEHTSFLQLPPEIRNTVYEYTARNSETISIGLNGILYSPPLSLVCRQLREEYEKIYIDEAPRCASTIKIHLVNFVHKTATKNVFDVVGARPQLEGDIERKYVFRVFLTNTFDHYLEQLRSLHLADNEEDGRNHCRVEVFYQPKTFDVQYCQQLLPKLRWNVSGDHGSPKSRSEWRMIEEAFEVAFKRYGLEVKGGPRKRKRL